MKLRLLSYLLLVVIICGLGLTLFYVFRARQSIANPQVGEQIIIAQARSMAPMPATGSSASTAHLIVGGTPVQYQPTPAPFAGRYTYQNHFPADQTQNLPLYLIDKQTGEKLRLGDESGAALYVGEDANYMLWFFSCYPHCVTLQQGLYAHSFATGEDIFVSALASGNLWPKISGEWIAYSQYHTGTSDNGDLFATNLRTRETITLTNQLLVTRPGESEYFSIGDRLAAWAVFIPLQPTQLVIYDLAAHTVINTLNQTGTVTPELTRENLYNLTANDTVVNWSRYYGYDTVTGSFFTMTLAPPNWIPQPVVDITPVTEKARVLYWTFRMKDQTTQYFKAPLIDASPSAKPCVEGQNLVQNGDLENVATHNVWQQSGSPSDLIVNELPPNSPQAGQWAIRLGRYSNAQPVIQQTLNIPSGVKHITLAFDVRASSWDIWGGDQLQVDLIDPVTQQSIVVTPVQWTNRQLATGGWVPLQVDIQDWPGIDTPLYLVFRVQTDWAFPTDFTLDNIRFLTGCA